MAISSLARHQQSVIGDLLDQRNVPIPKQTLQTSSQSQQLPFGLVDLLSQEHVLDTPSSTVCTFTPDEQISLLENRPTGPIDEESRGT